MFWILGRKSLHKHSCFGFLTEYMGPQGKTILSCFNYSLQLNPTTVGSIWGTSTGSADISSDDKLFENHFLTSFLKPTAWWLANTLNFGTVTGPGRRETHAGLILSLAHAAWGIPSPMNKGVNAGLQQWVWSPHHWTTREFPWSCFKLKTHQWPTHFSFPTNTGRNCSPGEEV